MAVAAAVIVGGVAVGLDHLVNWIVVPPPQPVPGVTAPFTFSILNAGLLLASSMIGLLFASLSRGMNLTFDDLLTPLEDLLPPWVRFTFYGMPCSGSMAQSPRALILKTK